jgi:hypothetical protein
MKTLIYSLVPTVAAYNTVSVPKFVREAEIKHGRVAMVSSVAIPVLDTLSPDGLGVNFVNNMPVENQLLLLGIFGCSEFSQMLKAYNFPSDTSAWFSFKDEHDPGNYNFDPLNISNPNNIDKIKSNEMFVGRLAMLGVFSEMLSEFCFQNSVV